MKIYIETYGCAANQADELTIIGMLNDDFDITEKIDESDIIIVITCGVKSSTENKIVTRLKEIRETFPGKKVIIAGCLPKIITKSLEQQFPSYSLAGPHHIDDMLDIVKRVASGERVVELSEEKLTCTVPKVVKEVQPIIIATGCLNACAYCSTKLAKGGLQSYPVECIVKSVEHAVKNGAKKILLTATDTGVYGLDIGTNLPALLKEIVKVNGNFKIRVGMMNPQYVLKFLDELIDVYKNQKIIKFLHLPVQSGSDSVLRLMNRGYKVDDFKKIVEKFRSEISWITISTDIICGFPGETDDDFKKTLELIKDIKPEVLNISKFYLRPGTKAAEMKQLKSSVIKERSRKLSLLMKDIRAMNRSQASSV